TIGTVAVPEMTSRGYKRGFTLGLLAAGGTLGIIIPPSIPLIVYGVITEESIGSLFLAGIGPGIMLIVLFGVFVVGHSMYTGNYDRLSRASWSERRTTTIRAFPTILLAVVIITGIYAGIFTPTEAAAIGFIMALLITGVILRTLTLKIAIEATISALRTTVVLFLVVVGAKIFGKAITLYQIPNMVSALVDTHVSEQWLFLLIVTGILLLIGLFLESLSMLLIMVPVLFPTVLALGVDPIWFGIFFVLLIEVALITPPVGLNLFVIQAVAKAQLSTVVTGVLPYIFIMLGSVLLIYLLPQIVLYIPFQLF
ncbi:MAG: TRAP transporter large permease, partial [Oceanibaculum sp.]